VIVWLGDKPVINTRKLPVDLEDFRRFNLGVVGCFGIEYPTICWTTEFVSFRWKSRSFTIRRPPEKDIAICNCQVKDNMTILVLITTCDMAMET